MPSLFAAQYNFLSAALNADAFQVLRFAGAEAVSTLYRFDILLVAAKPDLDLAAIMEAPASLELLREPSNEPEKDALLQFKGVAVSCELLRPIGQGFLYRVELAPKAWRLTMFRRNQIFLNKTVPQILTQILTEAGLHSGQDFEFRLRASYPVWEYVCQYEESHFEFLSRWLEREGMYYFFEQGPDGGKLVIADASDAHVSLGGEELIYSPESNLEGPERAFAVHRFQTRYEPTLRTVRVQDYNYRTPSLPLSAVAEVNNNGQGELHCYAEHPRTPSEASRLAKVRAEELRCRQQLSSGASYAPIVRSGYLFTLRNHYRPAANEEHLVLGVKHEGGQEERLRRITGLVGEDARDFYHNSFTAIPAATQFRPPLVTPKPRFHGVINAHIDAQGSGEFAELDEQGRYKVRLPFDLSDRPGGAASTWLRRAQPYAGADHGWHFPLHKGVEVMLAFLDGDPDRPVILGAAPNPLNPSPVRDANQTMHQLTTSGQNKLHMEDKAGSQRILMQTPTKNTWVRLGAPNDPPTSDADKDWESEKDAEGARWYSEGDYYGYFKSNLTMYVGCNYTDFILGGSEEVIVGAENISVVGLKTTVAIGGSLTIKMSYNHETNPLHCNTVDRKAEVIEKKLEHIESGMEALRKDLIVYENQIETSESRVTAVNRNIRYANDSLKAANTSISAVDQSLLAAQQKITATGAKVRAANGALIAAESFNATSVQRLQATERSITTCEKHTNTSGQNVGVGDANLNAAANVNVV
jgi:type VI secretion system secreted protein VgrG